MGLNNSQYDTIMRTYSQLQLQNQHDLELRRRKAYQEIPELAELDQEVASCSVRQAYLLLNSEGNELPQLKETLQQCSRRRQDLLLKHGFAADYLEMHYHCRDCEDTGYILGKKCHCFRKAAVDLFYTQSGLTDILRQENFDHFSYQYYPNDLICPATGLSSLQMAQTAVKICLQFIDQFDRKHENLFLYGGTGLGKTFLSHCIAKELIDRAHSVIYFSSFDLFEQLAQEAFHSDVKTFSREYILDCDLLILDDLGTEITNSFVASQLFLIINERIRSEKSTIISTNLSLNNFSEMYSERVFSRITSNFQLLQLYGRDIRLQKKLGSF